MDTGGSHRDVWWGSHPLGSCWWAGSAGSYVWCLRGPATSCSRRVISKGHLPAHTVCLQVATWHLAAPNMCPDAGCEWGVWSSLALPAPLCPSPPHSPFPQPVQSLSLLFRTSWHRAHVSMFKDNNTHSWLRLHRWSHPPAPANSPACHGTPRLTLHPPAFPQTAQHLLPAAPGALQSCISLSVCLLAGSVV